MNIKKNFNPLTLGILFTIVSGICTFTFIVPFITIMPASIALEELYKHLFTNAPYEKIGSSTLITLLLLFFLNTILYFIKYAAKRKQNQATENGFTGFLIFNFFIVHPLGLYAYTATNWSMARDGQYILTVFATYPFSSLAFACFGCIAHMIDANRYNKVVE